MQEWDCTVRMPSNFLQHIVVEAYTYSDAVSVAESSTGGRVLNATAKYRSSVSNDDDSDSSSSISGGGILVILLIVFCVVAWKYLLLFSGLAFLLWILWKNW